MKIYIIGINHKYQLSGLHSDWKQFSNFLYQYCTENNIDLVTEELSEEAIRKWNAEDSVARIVSEALRIKHLFCDPDSNQRRDLGIKSIEDIREELGYGRVLTRKQAEEVDIVEISFWNIRENYWIKRILENNFSHCLFIIGSNHIHNVSSLLLKMNIEYQIVSNDWPN